MLQTSKSETLIEKTPETSILNTANELEKKECGGIGIKKNIKIKCEKKLPLLFDSDDLILVSNPSFPKLRLVLAKDIKIGDFFLEKVPKKLKTPNSIEYKYQTFREEKSNTLRLEPDLMRLIGYWLAEGSVSKGNKGSNGRKSKQYAQNQIYYKYVVSFAFNKNEEIYINDVMQFMKKYFGVSSFLYKSKNSNAVSVQCSTRKGYEFFLQFFGPGSKNKRVPEYFINLEEDLIKELIKGFWRGDGSVGCYNAKDRRTHFNFCTISNTLSEQLRKMLLRLKINPAVCIRTPQQHHSCIVNGRLVEAKNNLNILGIFGKNAEILNSVLGESYTNFSSKNYKFFTNDYKYAVYPVRSVEII